MGFLSDIRFPVYPVPADRIIRRGTTSIAFYRQNDAEFILDDKGVPGTNLGQRRLYLKHIQGERLMRIRKHLKSFPEMIKSKYRFFIDYNGKVLHYTRTKVLPLRYYKILDFKRFDNGEVLLSVKGLHCKISTIYEPNYSHVGLLHIGVGGYIFYDYSDDPDLIGNTRLRRSI